MENMQNYQASASGNGVNRGRHQVTEPAPGRRRREAPQVVSMQNPPKRTQNNGDETAETENPINLPPLIPAESASQVVNPLRPATTQAGKQRTRMKWTEEVNIFIMRSYYTITELETHLTSYRQELHTIFKEKYPTTAVTEQRLSDQRRAIIRNNLIPVAILDRVKAEVAETLRAGNNIQLDERQNTSNTQTDEGRPREVTPQHNEAVDSLINNNVTQTRENRTLETLSGNGNQFATATHIKETFETARILYNGMNPTERPKIPRQSTSKKLVNIIVHKYSMQKFYQHYYTN